MSERNDTRYIEDARISIAMYCDTAGLTLEEGIDLAERLGDEIVDSASERASYLPESS